MKKEIVKKTNLKRKKGKLYYIDSDGDICEGIMCGIIQHDPPKYQGAIKVLKLGLEKEDGFLYTVGEDGNIYRVRNSKK